MTAPLRLLRVLGAIGIAGLLGAASAGAGPLEQTSCGCPGTYPPGSRSLELLLEPTAGPAGTVVTVSGNACSPGAILTVAFDGTVTGTMRADPSGAFGTTLKVAPTAPLGPHTVSVSGVGCQVLGTYAVQGPPRAPLAYTGFRGIDPLSEAASALVLFGVVLIVASHRRRRAHRGAQA